MGKLVSVIIPTRNSEKFLRLSLESIKNQNYKNIEIIIVDNNSTDQTKKIAKQYTKKVFNYGNERSEQVNYGAKRAKGYYLYYTGSDLYVDKTLIEQAVNKIEKENLDAIYMNVVTEVDKPNIWQRVRALERKFYFKEPGVSAARFYKREVFLELNGFDEKLGGISDDLEFQHRLDISGFKTGFIDAKENNLDEYKSLIAIIKRSLYYGWFLRRYMEKFPKKVKSQYRLIRSEFKKKKIIVENRTLFIFFIFYKLIQYFFGSLGIFLSVLTRNDKRVERYLYRLNYGRY